MNAKPELAGVAELVAQQLGVKNAVFCGKGAFKETYRVEDEDGKPMALKLVDRAKTDLLRTEREIGALKRCNSPRVAKVLDVQTFRTKDKRIFDVVLEEFFDGGSLDDNLQSGVPTRERVIQLAIGLFLAVRDLYPLRLVHRDIKPANIMFRKGSPDPVLVDFGLVRDLSQSSLTATWLPTGPGTPFYASPEQLNNDKAMIDWRSDQFSIGVVIGLLLTGRHPYQTDGANPNTAVFAVQERRGPAREFQQEMEKMALPAVTNMVRAWPVQRFSEPDQVLAQLKL
jgi:serine/threonine protein kinase